MYETQVIEIWQLISSMFLLKVKKIYIYFSQCISLFKEICLKYILILQYIFGKPNHVLFALNFSSIFLQSLWLIQKNFSHLISFFFLGFAFQKLLLTFKSSIFTRSPRMVSTFKPLSPSRAFLINFGAIRSSRISSLLCTRVIFFFGQSLANSPANSNPTAPPPMTTILSLLMT